MMMVILTKSEVRDPMADREIGPLRQIYEDMHNLNRRMHDMEERVRQAEYSARNRWEEDRKRHYPPQGYTQTSGLAPVLTDAQYRAVSQAVSKINSAK